MRQWLTKLKQAYWPTAHPDTLNVSSHCIPLDGVRGLAILLVLCYDCLKLPNDGTPITMLLRKFSASGWIGVDLFFVLSGFLITGILLETKGKAGYWKSFFLRRSVRIFPLYYATLLGMFVGFPLLSTLGVIASNPIPESLNANQLWYWCYAQNWLFAIQGAWPEERLLNHFWSLAVEEQFYLFWPLVIAWFSRKSLATLCVVLCAIALGLRYVLLLNDIPGISTYVMSLTRMDSLCMGAIVAIGMRHTALLQQWARWLPLVMCSAFVALVGVDVFYPVLKSQSFAAYSLGHTLLAISFVSLIASVVVVPPQHLLARVFSITPLLELGKYSYAIYVFHRFVYAGVMQFDWSAFPPMAAGWLIFFATLAGCLLIAQISWRFIEQPCLALKKYFPRPGETGKPLPSLTYKAATQPVPKDA